MNSESVQSLWETGVFQGITTNPTLLKREQKDRIETIKKLEKYTEGKLFVQLHGRSARELLEDYYTVTEQLSYETVGLKIPINFTGLEVIKQIKEHNSSRLLLGTAIYSIDQAVLAAMAGCEYIAPYVKRMEKEGIDPYTVIHETRSYFDKNRILCKIMAASFEKSNQVTKALISGAHTATVSPAIFKEMCEKESANKAIEVFNQDADVLKEIK